jgi:hypothetical protein
MSMAIARVVAPAKMFMAPAGVEEYSRFIALKASFSVARMS